MSDFYGATRIDPNREIKQLKNSLAERDVLVQQLKQERDALAAHQADLVRELQACQNVLHTLAHHGEVTAAYADDAKVVLNRTPSASLAERDAEVARKAILAARDDYRSEYMGQSIDDLLESFAEAYATKIRSNQS